jgi:hypothetical protein
MKRIQAKVLFHLFAIVLLGSASVQAEQVAVRQSEGLVRGFLVMTDENDKPIADGELAQVARGGRVVNHLTFHFRDGSLQDETAVFSQHGHFRLISDHIIHKGPAFPHPLEVWIQAASGEVKVVTTDDKGKPQTFTDHLKLSADLSNGMVLTLLKNLAPDAGPLQLAYVATTPKPRLVKLHITSEGKEPFYVGALKRAATHYVVRVEIGGLTGLVAPLLGKEPSPTHVWVLEGEAPAFIRMEGPLYVGGPICHIQLTSPAWRAAKPQEGAKTPERQPSH